MGDRRTKKITSRSIARDIALAFLDVFFLSLAALFFFFIYMYFKAPIAATLLKRTVPLTTVIYDRTGEHVLYEIHGEENRKIISHEKIPDTARVATVAAEDDSFYSHYGIDPLAVLRAIFTNLKNNAAQQGGSTITQQLARNAFLTREKTFRRKFLEAILAIKIERKFTKDQILDMYFNQIPYGSSAYGIEAAAETFFGKRAENLTLDEAAFLAALPKATTYYSPYGAHRRELALRQKAILSRIVNLQLVDEETVRIAQKTDTFAKIISAKKKIEAPHFVMYVKDELEKKYGKKTVEDGGFQVYTTLNYEAQILAEQIVQKDSGNNLKAYGASNTALVALNPQNGEILAMVGSLDYFDERIDGQVNVVLRPRQPGSSFKPFAYATAFEKGYQPETFILDEKTNFGPDGTGHDYIPRNYDGKFHGLVSMRQALAMSLNIPAVKTLSIAGIDDTIALAHRLGITTLNDRNRYGLSLVLGGGEVKLLDMTAGFAVFANDGRGNSPTPFLQIIDHQGKLLEKSQPQNSPVLDPQIARKINAILSDNASRTPIFGPNNRLFIPGRSVAAKTGTTQKFRDAWTIGYTPYLAVGVWAGNNDNHPMRPGADGSYVAAPIWNKFMSQAIQKHTDDPFLAYAKEVNRSSGADIKITYYKKKSGKKISEKKAKDIDPEKVEARIETPPSASGDSKYLFADLQFARHPMIISNWENFSIVKR